MTWEVDNYLRDDGPSYGRNMSFRAFISADVPGEGRMRDLLSSLHAADPTLKVVDPSIMHVTLKFLGDIQEVKVGPITEVMRKAATDISPFEVALRGVGAFPNRNRPRVIWVGLENAQPLITLAQRIDEDLSSLGFERERRGFAPHLTLARARVEKYLPAVREFIEENSRSDLGKALVDRIKLKRSVLNRSGPQYSTVEEVMLSPDG